MYNTSDKKRKNTIKVIGKVVKILDVLSLQKKMNCKSISQLTKINITTTQRILNDLFYYNFVEYNDKNREYFLGKKLIRMGLLANSNLDYSYLLEISEKYIEALSETTEETVSIEILEGKNTIVFKSISASHFTKFEPPIGSHFSLYAGSAGKLFLAYFENEAILKYLNENELVPYTKKTITNPKKLMQELKKIRKNGYSTSIGEIYSEGRSVSFPIFNSENKVIASLNIYGLKERFTLEKIKQVVSLGKDYAKNISTQIKF